MDFYIAIPCPPASDGRATLLLSVVRRWQQRGNLSLTTWLHAPVSRNEERTHERHHGGFAQRWCGQDNDLRASCSPCARAGPSHAGHRRRSTRLAGALQLTALASAAAHDRRA